MAGHAGDRSVGAAMHHLAAQLPNSGLRLIICSSLVFENTFDCGLA